MYSQQELDRARYFGIGDYNAMMQANQQAQQQYDSAMNSGNYQGPYPVDPKTGKPLAQKFNSMIGADGLLSANLQLGSGGYDPRAIEAQRTEAFRTGPSQWSQLQKSAQSNQLARTQQGQLAQGLDRLAATGGLSGGSRERMIKDSMTQGLLNRQDLNSKLAIQDNQNQMSTRNNLVGQELQLAGFNQGTQQYNIDKSLNERLQERAFNTNNYNEQMRAWAAERTAAAAPSGGGKK
jgi:hypothetical protein